MLPEAQVIHALPDRLRVRIQSRRGHRDYFAAVSEWLGSFPHVLHHEVRPATGGILLHTDAEFDRSEFTARARDAGLFELSPLPGRPDTTVSDPLEALLHGPYMRHAALGLLLAMALLQIRRGQVMAPATSLLWYAFALTELQQH